MREPLSALTYVSQSLLLQGLDQRRQFTAILQSSRRNNSTLKISGALLFDDGIFLQVLEGPRTAVETVFETIQSDVRHTFVRHLGTEPISERRFGRWTMAFVNPGEVGSSFVGSKLSELRVLENARAAKIIDWMVDQLESAERSVSNLTDLPGQDRLTR